MCVFVHDCVAQKNAYLLCVCVYMCMYMCMYAHKFSAISFLLNGFPFTESILPAGVRMKGKQCDWWVEHAHSFRQEGLKIGRRVGQK